MDNIFYNYANTSFMKYIFGGDNPSQKHYLSPSPPRLNSILIENILEKESEQYKKIESLKGVDISEFAKERNAIVEIYKKSGELRKGTIDNFKNVFLKFKATATASRQQPSVVSASINLSKLYITNKDGKYTVYEDFKEVQVGEYYVMNLDVINKCWNSEPMANKF